MSFMELHFKVLLGSNNVLVCLSEAVNLFTELCSFLLSVSELINEILNLSLESRDLILIGHTSLMNNLDNLNCLGLNNCLHGREAGNLRGACS